MPLLEEVITAHGGLDRWSRVDRLTLRVRIGGRLFAMKLASTATRSLTAEIDPRRVHAILRPFPAAGLSGEFDERALTIRDDRGRVVSRREIRRGVDGDVRRKLRWDDLDVLYFLGYALWNYSVTPFVFTWPGFECRPGDDWRERDGERWRTLRVRFPPAIPTHSREQTFFFDDRGWLRRLDYTADVFSRFAHGAHLCLDHRTFDGFVFPTHRVVYPRGLARRPIAIAAVMEGWVDDVEIA
jgi:hypothetical protein